MPLKMMLGIVIHWLRTDNNTQINPTIAKISSLYQQFNEAVNVDYKQSEHIYGVYMTMTMTMTRMLLADTQCSLDLMARRYRLLGS